MGHTTLYRDRPIGLAGSAFAGAVRVFGQIEDLGHLIGRAYRAAHAVERISKRRDAAFENDAKLRRATIQDIYDRHFRVCA